MLYDERSNIELEAYKHAKKRLKYIININTGAPNKFEAFWNRTVDHRIIGLMAITSSFKIKYQKNNFRSDSEKLGVSFSELRRLCRCTDRTMYTIIREGVERGELLKSKKGRNIFIKGTKKLINSYVSFEKKLSLRSASRAKNNS